MCTPSIGAAGPGTGRGSTAPAPACAAQAAIGAGRSTVPNTVPHSTSHRATRAASWSVHVVRLLRKRFSHGKATGNAYDANFLFFGLRFLQSQMATAKDAYKSRLFSVAIVVVRWTLTKATPHSIFDCRTIPCPGSRSKGSTKDLPDRICHHCRCQERADIAKCDVAVKRNHDAFSIDLERHHHVSISPKSLINLQCQPYGASVKVARLGPLDLHSDGLA